MFLLTLINTIILVTLFGKTAYEIIKTKILDKTDLDEKIIEKIKDLVSKK